MKNNKGFSMVEVLAVVVILGILGGLAMPSIQDYMEENKKKYNKSVERQLLLSGKDYYANNQNLLPRLTYEEKISSGQKVNYVTAPTLSTENYLKNELVDYDGQKCQESYVLVAKKPELKEEEWHSCLICGEGDNETNYSKDDIYCDLNANWYDKEPPTCEVTVSSSEEERDLFNTNQDTININEIEFTKLEDNPQYENDRNYSSIIIYNSKTKVSQYIDVKDKSAQDITDNIDAYSYLEYFKNDGIYSVYIMDKGYNRTLCKEALNIDNTLPTCKIKSDTEGPTAKATLTVDAQDANDIDIDRTIWKISDETGDEISECNGKKDCLVEKNGTYEAIVYDKAENKNTCQIIITNIESYEPLMNITAKKAASGTTVLSNSWSNEGLNFTIENTNKSITSGVTIKYCMDTGNTCTPNTEVEEGTTITEHNTITGTYYIRTQGTTGTGKISGIKTYTAKVDTTMPSLSLTATKRSSGTSVVSGTWSNEGLNFTLTQGLKGASGSNLYYCKDATNTCNPATKVSSGTKITTYNALTGTYYIRYKAVSGSGVSSNVGSYTAKIDRTTPTVTLSATKKTAGTKVSSGSWSNQGLNFTFTKGTTGGSGSTIYYCKDTSNTCTPSTKATSGTAITSYNTTTGTYYIRYKIVGGTNISSSIGSYTAKVDTTSPVITHTANKTAIDGKYTIPVTIKTKCTDSGGSLINSFTVSGTAVSGASGTSTISKATSISTAKTTSISATCKDKAGNSASKTGSFVTFKPVTGITISSIPSPLWIVVNGSSTSYQKSTAKVTVSPSTATNTGVTWSSSNTSVVTVASDGTMTPKSVGSATIKATAKDGTGVTASKTVHVYKVKTRDDTDISRTANGGTPYGKITLTTHQASATNGSGIANLKVTGKFSTSSSTWLGTGNSATAANCESYARWICLTTSTSNPTGSTGIPYSSCKSSLKLVKSRTTTWSSSGHDFCGSQTLSVSEAGTYYIMLGGGVSTTSCTTCGTESTKDFSSSGDGEHINAKFTSYSLIVDK